jgi:hypothetical protein
MSSALVAVGFDHHDEILSCSTFQRASGRRRALGDEAVFVLLRLAYLGVTNALAMLRLLPMSDRARDAEILALRHQIMVLQRQLHGEKVRFTPR